MCVGPVRGMLEALEVVWWVKVAWIAGEWMWGVGWAKGGGGGEDSVVRCCAVARVWRVFVHPALRRVGMFVLGREPAGRHSRWQSAGWNCSGVV